jgi:flagellar biosynthesis protein FlhG
MAEQTTIIPIAGGKGGVGKSFLTANLAVALAQRGHSTIAVDLDLGNSNLHSLLGVENRYPGIGEFLRGTVKCAPEDLVVETTVPGLGLILGDGRMPFMANITYNQKRTLVRILKVLPARYVLLDLSAGTSFNTLDLFMAGNSGIIVTTPEHPAIMSALVFVKNLLLRAIDQSLRRQTPVLEKLNEMYKQSVRDPVFTIKHLRNVLVETDPNVAEKLDSICQSIRPRFFYNMAETLKDIEMFGRIDRTLDDILSIECDHFGLALYDVRVRESLRQPGIFLTQYPTSATAMSIDRVAHRVIQFWDESIEGSAELLTKYAREVFAQRDNPAKGG